LTLDSAGFDTLWQIHPSEFHVIKMHGRLVPTPRWQQAYGVDYHYTGRTNTALPVPPLLAPLLDWARDAVDERLNGVLVNWYNGALRHYIGRHRDSTVNMVEGAPIVTISFGEERCFRLRPWRGSGVVDFAARDGAVFVMSYETNRAWTHEVPHSAKRTGRRISVTLRAFVSG
jgi:alkylated DNA repair dioxygenase AlkB